MMSKQAPMSGCSRFAALASLLLGCTGAPPAEPVAPDPPAPVPGAAVSWSHPDSPAVIGQGECQGVSLASVLDSIRGQFGEVGDIQSYRGFGPQGVVLNAGMPVAQGSSPPPATGTSSFVVGLASDRSFGAIFFRGARCRGDLCDEREYWYFETATQCRPRAAGHLRITRQPGGRFGTCLDVTGAPLWSFPAAPGARERCDADWAAQDISKNWLAYSLRPATEACAGEAIVPIEVAITQERDLAVARVVVRGSGIPYLDGREVRGKVERQRLEAFFEETTQEACAAHRSIRFSLDFEESNNGFPNGFGLVDVGEKFMGTCPASAAGCSASLHLIHR
jgi:hypothetical protein